MKEEISPEERLLKLIRGKNKDKDFLRAIKEKKSKLPESNEIKEEVIEVAKEEKAFETPKKNKLNFALKEKWTKKYSPIEFVKNILLFIFSVLSLYLLVTLVIINPYSRNSEKKMEGIETNSKVNALQVQEAEKSFTSAPKPYSYYEEEIGKRNLFSSIVTDEVEKPIEKEAGLKELTSSLSLMGIIWGEKPEAIIQDSKTNKKYFLNKGGYIGEIVVEEIFGGKVILNYNGERVDLVL